MSSSLLLSFNSATAKYSRLNKKIRKSINSGEFWRYTSRKRHHLLHKIERLRLRLAELKLAVRLAGAGLAAGLMMMGGESQAQTLGPFVNNPLENPLPQPAFQRMDYPTVTYWDLDNDGDLDASVAGSYDRYLKHYRNVGPPERPHFEEYNPSGTFVNWYGSYSNKGRAAFGDVDDDGDLDLLIGQNRTDDGYGVDDYLYFYRNIGTPEAPNFEFVDNEISPYKDFKVTRDGWPAFTDFDKDGDLDLVIAGEYFDEDADENAWLQFFRNDKVGHEAGVPAEYHPLPNTENPLYIGNIGDGALAIAFADLDGDGDEDFFYGFENGIIGYRRNDGGTFVEQTGPYVYNQANPGASTGNPLEIPNLEPDGYDQFISFGFADLDNDGDTDLTIGRYNRGTMNSPYVYVRNTGNGVMVADRTYTNNISGFSVGQNSNSSLIDYDRDGDLDLITSGSARIPTGETTHDRVGHALFKNENNTFVIQTFLNDPFNLLEHPEAGKMKVADVDGDSDFDVLMIGREYDYGTYGYYNYITYFRNDGGTYTKIDQASADNPFLFINQQEPDPVDMDFVDIDNDQLPDMALGISYNHVQMYKNTGTAQSPEYTRRTDWETGMESPGNFSPKFIDLDVDGDTDLIIGKYNSFWYFENIGTKEAPAWKEYHGPGNDNSENKENPFRDVSLIGKLVPELADIDGDGDRDLLFSVNEIGQDGYFTYYENQNPAPTVTPTRTEIPFTPGSPMILDPNITLSDSDSDRIVEIRVKIGSYQQGKEKLTLTSAPAGIGSNWDDATGILTIFGGDGTVATYQAALRVVAYVYIDSGSFFRKGQKSDRTSARSISKNITITTLDADLTIAPSNTNTFNITHANDEPVVTPGTFNAAYNNAPVQLIPAITVTDPDDGTLSAAEISFTSGTYRSGQDQLSLPTTIGSITATYDGTTGVLHLTGTGSVAEYQTALRSVLYNNQAGAGVDPTPRTLSIKVNDGENDSNPGTISLSVFSVNASAVLAPVNANGVTYTSGNLIINPGVTVTDDGSTITSATVSFINGFMMGEDKLLFTTQNGITGTFTDTTAVLTLSGSATLANYEAALRSVQYTNVATTKTGGARQVAFIVNDGLSNSNASSVIVTVANTPPTITGTASSFWAAGEVVINNSIVLNDADNATLQGATVAITNGFNPAEDQLVFTDQNGITGATAPGSSVLTLSGTSSVANYQAALRSVRYKNASGAPSTTDRAFTITVTDGGTTTTLTGTVIVINKPPAIDVLSRKTSAGGNVAFSVAQNFTDPDDNLDLSTLSVTSAHGAQIIISGGFITVSYRNIDTYEGTDEVTMTICDTGGRCATTVVNIEVSDVPYIYSGMSPNGDGINDWFHIEFLPEKTQVAIYNRWGDAIFETDDYDTTDPARRFEGKNKNGTELIAGSYYYKVRLPDKRVLTGYILLNR
ncbi:MAG TPA: FG-GAP-like repeat-containing protein [Cyclobacteriaceae bacterium]|nr:FG-GAP-like repeat-containing protein [Cyclobacteriaceae bacterium]